MAVLFYFCTTEDDPEMSKHIPKAVYRSRITFFIALLGLSSWWGYPAKPQQGQPPQTSAKQTLFKSMPTAHTGVDFVNALHPRMDTRHNLFDFDYYYNGGGVALADFNNDGWVDIFFCGNEVSDRLYYNRGNWQFEDVTEVVGIHTKPGWSNGVAVVDINDDGWMDIYLSRGGPDTGQARRNVLFINHKGEYFVERAEAYGLDDRGLSTQSVFFDYDRDGDLDCFVLNENDFYGLAPIDFFNVVGSDSLRFHTASRCDGPSGYVKTHVWVGCIGTRCQSGWLVGYLCGQ